MEHCKRKPNLSTQKGLLKQLIFISIQRYNNKKFTKQSKIDMFLVMLSFIGHWTPKQKNLESENITFEVCSNVPNFWSTYILTLSCSEGSFWPWQGVKITSPAWCTWQRDTQAQAESQVAGTLLCTWTRETLHVRTFVTQQKKYYI